MGEADKLFRSGMQIPHSLYLMDAHGEMTNPLGRGYGDGDPDGTAWPIPRTMSRVWGEGPARAQILMTLRDHNGVADPAEPRAALERVLERFASLKLTPVCALELEFYLIDKARDESGVPQPPLCPRTGARERAASVYGIDDLDRYHAFLSALTEAAAEQNVPVSAASKEYAPGQFEANLRHQSDARAAADHAVFLKQIVKSAARANGFDAASWPSPIPTAPGSGLHIHMSLLDAQGRNVFDDGTAMGSEISAPCYRRAAGADGGFDGAVCAECEFLSPLPAGHVRAGEPPLGCEQPLRRSACAGRPLRGAAHRASRRRR